MGHYAQIDENNIVLQVVVTDNSMHDIETWLVDNLGGTWVQTSYNSREGIHYGSDGLPDGEPHIRYNYAGIGHIYDAEGDAFHEPKGLYPSWILNKDNYTWIPPIAKPEGIPADWDEENQKWIIIPQPYPSWTYNSINNRWDAPKPYPAYDGYYNWDENSQEWYLANPKGRK